MDIVVYNNLTTEAMEASGQTLEEMLEAQARLLRRLTDPSRQRAIINLDGVQPDAPRMPLKAVNFTDVNACPTNMGQLKTSWAACVQIHMRMR